MDKDIIKLLNRDYKIVFTHKKKHRCLYLPLTGFYGRRLIGAGQLIKYVGEENALAAINYILNTEHALEQIAEKKYRTLGRLTFYRK